MKSNFRALLTVPLLAAAFACSSGPDTADGAGGTAAAAAGSSATPTAGTTAVGSGGTGTGGTQPLMMVPLAGSGQAIGGGDQGMFFTNDGSVPIMPVDMGGTGGTGAGGGTSIPGDGKTVISKIGGSISGTATFAQKGEDVTVTVALNSGCADGKHMFRVYDGDSCDNAGSEGMPWTPRGVGFGPADGITCSGGKGMMMDVRSGADKTKNITVGDHVFETDVSAHVVIVSDEKDPNSRAACGNFF